MSETSITLMIGLPGAGKSAYLKATAWPQIRQMPVVLSPDDFRKEITGHAFYAPAEDFVWGCVKTCARVLVRKHDIIIDATHLGVGSRDQWLKIGKALDVDVRCVWLDIPLDVCLTRNQARLADDGLVPAAIVEEMSERFVPPSEEEGFSEIKKISQDEADELFAMIC